MKNLFEASAAQEVIERINSLTPETQPQWGKMNASEVMAHLNVGYEMMDLQ